jgi:cation diffusion facilitator family transporter
MCDIELNPRVDPLNLAQHIKTDLSSLANPKLVDFYKKQNDLINSFLDPFKATDDQEMLHLKLKIAINGSFAANVFLFALQLTASILSGSLALFASSADSFMDVASSFVLFFASKIASQHNLIDYPVGKSRFEPVGIIIFATLMSTLSLQILITSIQSLINGNRDIAIGTVSIICISVAIATKTILYLYCKSLKQFPVAKVYMTDHRNDIFLNSTAIVFSILAEKFLWYIDPVGAILIALGIIYTWIGTAREHVTLLAGKSADPAFLSKITYISLTHDPQIKQIDTCRAYHSGNNYFVEVDVVFPPETLLYQAHDIGESLQIKLESLDDVDRAFVHLDYETDHKPEHKKSK